MAQLQNRWDLSEHWLPPLPLLGHYSLLAGCGQGASVTQKSDGSVTIEKDGRDAPAGSILGVISLAINQGDTVTISAEGDDADAVLDQLVTFLETDHDAE